MQVPKLAVLIIALSVSPSLAGPLLQERDVSFSKKEVSWYEKRAPSPSKSSSDIDTIASSTVLVNSYLDRISLAGTKGSQYINPFLSKFWNLTSVISSINDDNTSAASQAFTPDDKYQLCTTVWNLIYRERNLMNYLGTLSSTFIKNGATKNVKKAIDSYSQATDTFFGELLPRLDVCNEQLNSALDDFDTTLNSTTRAFS